MRKILGSILIIMLLTLVGCSAAKTEDIKFSESILLSINNGAPGFGTIEDCVDAEIFIYTDRTIKVVVYHPAELEIASLEMTEEDYDKLTEIAVPQKISKLKIEEDQGVSDGSSYHIALYGEQDESVCYKGGYMPKGKKFWEVYHGVKEILQPYGIGDIVESYRESLRSGLEIDTNMTDAEKAAAAEYTELARLLEGEWISESQSAYIKVFPSDETFNKYKISIMADLQIHPFAKSCYACPLTSLSYEIPHWISLSEEEQPAETETAVTYTLADGELSSDGLMIADKDGEYFKFQLIEGDSTWYYFYPYQEEKPIDWYITANTMGQMIREMIDMPEMKEDAARQTALNLIDLGVAYLYPDHCSVELNDDVYTVEVLARCLEFKEGKYVDSDQTVVFYVDTEGNPMYESIWRITE